MTKPTRHLRIASEPVRAAPLSEVEAHLKEWDDTIVTCRAYGHDFKPYSVQPNERLGYFKVVRLCRCKAEHHAEVAMASGHVFSSWIDYSHTNGYLLEGVGRIMGDARDRVRLDAIVRTFPQLKMTAKEQREDRPRSYHTRQALGLEAASG
jgi:hypothetical protein